MIRRLAAVMALATVLAACGGGAGSTGSSTAATTDALSGATGPSVHVTGATITPTGEGTATITFGAHNAGTDIDQLLGVTCDCGGSARVLGPDGDDVDGVDIAPEETLFLGPGTATVEIRGIPAPLEPGSFVGLTVEFANGGEVVTDAEVAPKI